MEERLLAVAHEIRSPRHADIGTDHGLLPLYLVQHRRCQYVIATDRSENALVRPRQLLRGYPVEVRLGDGLDCLEEGEVDSLSLCGMGGSNIVEILEANPKKIPDHLVVQANRDSRKVRAWALESGFHLRREQLIQGTWLYTILSLSRGSDPDPAYRGVTRELGVRFGPLLLQERHPLLVEALDRRWNEFVSYPDSEERDLLKLAQDFLRG